ncbi:MAG TPA: HAD family acid phosphatase [Edaphobacter sp.]|nr:HAD family acid phosphatase [Edaphobacter sp.]
MNGTVRMLVVVGLMTMPVAGQTVAPTGGPPTCSILPGGRGQMVTPSTRPTAQQIQATAEASAADPTVLIAAEPVPNFGVQRYRLADYAECVGTEGCYWADLDAQTKRAAAVLDRAIAVKKAGEKLALVLDIDETSLSDYCEMRSVDYGFLQEEFNKWVVSPQAGMAIPGTLELFNKARAAGLEVFFITGRSDDLREATARSLEQVGFKGWKGLALRVGPQKQMSTVEYKGQERQKIVDAGYRIVLNMGDQWSDLNGQARGETSVKLPNPFYYLP